MPSTVSRLTLVRPLSFLYHHPPPQHLNSVPTTRVNSATSPSPLLGDVGSTTNAPGSVERTTAAPAPPLSKGMWAGTYLLDGGIGGRETQGGTQQVGGPSSASQKRAMTLVVARFFLIISSPNPQPTPNVSNPTQRPPPTSSLTRRPDDPQTQR